VRSLLFAGRYPDAINPAIVRSSWSRRRIRTESWRGLLGSPAVSAGRQSFESRSAAESRYYTAVGIWANVFPDTGKTGEPPGFNQKAIQLADDELKITRRAILMSTSWLRDITPCWQPGPRHFTFADCTESGVPKISKYQMIAASHSQQFGEVTAAFGYLERSHRWG